jgi:hypothetical protein
VRKFNRELRQFFRKMLRELNKWVRRVEEL